MARVNVGVDPFLLADQHLIAESVEITMITGSFKKSGFVIKSDIPETFKLGKGHMNFFKPKILYLHKRLERVNLEMLKRGFNPGTQILLNEYPERFLGDWEPTLEESNIVRQRIGERLITRTNGLPGSDFYRYCGFLIGTRMERFVNDILNAELYDV